METIDTASFIAFVGFLQTGFPEGDPFETILSRYYIGITNNESESLKFQSNQLLNLRFFALKVNENFCCLT